MGDFDGSPILHMRGTNLPKPGRVGESEHTNDR